MAKDVIGYGRKMKPDGSWALAFTITWMVLLSGWAIALDQRLFTVPFTTYATWRLVPSVVLPIVAVLCLFAYQHWNIFEDTQSSSLGPWASAGLAFWVLFPPCWFFVEYNGVVAGALVLPRGVDRSVVKDYADYASKIWAAFVALYGLIVAHRVKIQEEAIKAEQLVRSSMAKIPTSDEHQRDLDPPA